jgi:isoleucyl-tRNA synthetase
MPANQALNAHPEFDYALVRTEWQGAPIACWCWQRARRSLPAAWGSSQGEVVATTTGAALERIEFDTPFFDRTSPVYLAEYVTLDAGTGIVHSSPAYGVEDFLSCAAYGMQQPRSCQPVHGRTARTSTDLPFFGGMSSGRPTRRSSTSSPNVGTCSRTVEIIHAQLHALLAPQDPAHLSRHRAVVRRHGQDAEGGGSTLRERALPASRPPSSTRLGPGAPARDDRQPSRLVHLAPAQLGRADPLLPAQGDRRAAPATQSS